VVVQLLLENRADLETVDRIRMTPLMLAAQNGQLATIAVLLTNGPDIEAEDKYGTSLIRASKGGHEVVVVFLLERGAKSSALDQICGKTALHWAAERGHENISKHLVSHGRFLDVPDAFGETALHYTAGNGHEIVVEALLGKRPNVLL
jgi:ankyrin repeat protein